MSGIEREFAGVDRLADEGPTLSAAGATRREAMLADLERRVRSRGRRRVAVLSTAIAAPVLLLAWGVVALRPWAGPAPAPSPLIAGGGAGTPELATSVPTPAPPRTGDGGGAELAARSPAAPARLVRYVADDPGVISRLAVETGPMRAEVIGDAELLGALREAGLPAGLVRTPGRVSLAFHAAPSGGEARTP